MYKANGAPQQEYIAYQHVGNSQIIEDTVVDGLVDVDDSAIDTNDGYGYVKMDDEDYIAPETGKRRYRMRTRAPASIYYCAECDKSFKYPSKIQEHMRKHTGEKPFLCTTCGARFSQGHVLKAHVRNHQGERPFKCTFCDRCFATVAHRNTHEKATHTEQHQQRAVNAKGDEMLVYGCPFEQCGFQSPNQTEVEEHLQIEHNYDMTGQEEMVQEDHIWTEYPAEQPQEILEHGYDVYIGDELQPHHLEEHIDEAGSSERQLLPEELEQHCPDEVPPSAHEIEVETTLPRYQIQIDPTAKAKMGGVVMDQYPDIMRGDHYEGIYDTDEFEGTVQISVDPNPPRRGKQLPPYPPNTRSIVEMDVRTIEMINPKPETIKMPKSRSNGARNLDWIIDAVAKGHDVSLASPHNRKKPTIHTCQYCGKVDKYPSKIRAHMRTHTGEKPFKCDICGMQFAQRTPMRLHMRRHMNQKPFVCPVAGCGEKFVSGALRNLHISKKHLKEKKYVCIKGCGRYFASAKNQRAHEDKCTYSRELEDDPVYQQLIYDHNQSDDEFDSEGSAAIDAVEKSWESSAGDLLTESVDFKMPAAQSVMSDPLSYVEEEEYIENTT